MAHNSFVTFSKNDLDYNHTVTSSYILNKLQSHCNLGIYFEHTNQYLKDIHKLFTVTSILGFSDHSQFFLNKMIHFIKDKDNTTQFL